MKTTTLIIVVTGSDDFHVKAFLFTHENVTMRVNNADDNVACIFAGLDGHAHSSSRYNLTVRLTLAE